MKRLQIGLLLVSLAIRLPYAYGALITQYAPVNPSEPLATGYTFLDIDLTNNDEGAIYNSGELSLLTGLAHQLWTIVPVNQVTYADIGELVADWNVLIRPPPTGQIHQGWNRTVNADGSIDLSNLGTIGGIPDDDYTVWRDSINHPNQNTMSLTIQIPLSQLELDGEPGYDPATDARIELGSTELPSAFVGFQDIDNIFHATGLSYEVIPEPSSVLLSVFGLLLFGWYHRVVRKSARGGGAI